MGYGGDLVSKTMIWIDLGCRLKLFKKLIFLSSQYIKHNQKNNYQATLGSSTYL